ncbi:MAG: hypothetical protein QNJ38_11735 [Prochloraceae cyanobacterium]|nr:hypothetical protein [Prochloraceae cyanobacterium]
MFFFWGDPYCYSKSSRKEMRQRKLEFLKSMRDNLEARLSGLNASIETIERQLRDENNA